MVLIPVHPLVGNVPVMRILVETFRLNDDSHRTAMAVAQAEEISYIAWAVVIPEPPEGASERGDTVLLHKLLRFGDKPFIDVRVGLFQSFRKILIDSEQGLPVGFV